MDSEAQIPNMEVSSCTIYSEKSRVLEAKDVDRAETINVKDIGPGTPLPDRTNRDALFGSDTPLSSSSFSSPLRVTSGSDTTAATESNFDVCTPKSHVFNPFAPGPDELMFAPYRKSLMESRVFVARRLHFDSNNEPMDRSPDKELEESYLESIYKSVLDAVVSTQAEDNLSENLPLEIGLSDGLRTPTSLPLLTGIAETCPGAPMKPVGRSRDFINISLCRKLEF